MYFVFDDDCLLVSIVISKAEANSSTDDADGDGDDDYPIRFAARKTRTFPRGH